MGSLALRVRQLMESLPIFTAVDLPYLYAELGLISADDQAAARSALYGCVAGTGVSKSRSPRDFRGVLIKFPVSDSDTEDIVLSLPVAPKSLFARETNDQVKSIMERLDKEIGPAVVGYWIQHAQARSVVVAARAMSRVRQRDAHCRICEILSEQRPEQRSWLALNAGQTVRVSHIVPRKTSFYLAIESVLNDGLSVFSVDGTQRLQEILRADPWHNDERYMVKLCATHDRVIGEQLRIAAAGIDDSKRSAGSSRLGTPSEVVKRPAKAKRQASTELASANQFTFVGNGFDATAVWFEGVITVLKGSTISSEEAPTTPASARAARTALLSDGTLVRSSNGAIRFSRDRKFENPSLAAGVVAGGSRSGPREWKHASDLSLKEWLDQGQA